MKRPLVLLLLLLAYPLAVSQLASGCSNQGEGQLCSTLNNDDDCELGLTCTPVPGTGASVCCSQGSTNIACIGVSPTTATSSGGGGFGGAGGAGGMGGAAGMGGMGGGGMSGTGGGAADAGDGG